MPNQPEIADLLVDLQARVAHQDDTVLKLNDIVASQQREITELTKAVQKLARQMQSLRDVGSGGGGEVADERPPHY